MAKASVVGVRYAESLNESKLGFDPGTVPDGFRNPTSNRRACLLDTASLPRAL